MATGTGIEGYVSLGADINKKSGVAGQETKEGVSSEKLPELTLDMSDDDIIKLTDKWEKVWKDSDAKSVWEKQIEENENYWLGKQFDLPKADKNRPMVDNLVFESLETYLPQATRRNPEPLVTLDNSELDENGNPDPIKLKYVNKVKGRLSDLADKNKIRLKLKKTARHWAIYQLGVAKMGWDLDKDIPIVRIIRPKKMILDPTATIDEDGYTGNRIGEYRKMEASKIISIIGEDPENKGLSQALSYIKTDLAKGDLATEITFVEWWTPEYFCWKLAKHILLKKKNPHWNQDLSEPATEVDDYGQEIQSEKTIPGLNHFPTPKMPYEFLSVFNLGDQPMDKTSLISQNLSNQDLINKRNKQIDKNADKMNGGVVISLQRAGLTQPQARNVSEAIRKGGAVVIPSGSPQDAIYFPNVPGLPADIYNQLNDTRARLRDIFGIKGSSQAGLETEKTVRGKIISKGLDTDRIGGGVTEYLEQFAGNLYNWFVQLLYVYDTGFQFVEGAIPPKILISVKEGSLLPKDSTSIANQALELAGLNRISNLDLYKRLEWPNPEEIAANIWLEVNAPQLLYKDNPLVQEALALAQASAVEASNQESMKSENKFNQDMEKERVKGDIKDNSEAKRSLLSAVPQNTTA